MFVVAPQNRGWVLEGLCRDVDRVFGGRSAYFYCEGRPPLARAYFFSHYSLFGRYADHPRIEGARSIVLFTHPSVPELASANGARLLARADFVVSMSSMFADELTRAGVPHDRVRTIVPGVDPTAFESHARGGGAVGFSSAYYDRKNPELIAEVVELRPDYRFRLLGRGWRDWPGFDALHARPNLEYLELDLSDYPDFYRSIDVFVSPSDLEGGPIPLLEAMMSNVVPVATRTGFATDLIRDGVNGFTCPVGADAEEFARLIDAAQLLRTDVRATVVHRTSRAFGEAVVALL